MTKRIGVYLTYDKQEIVDGYIGYMLKELKTCVDFLTVVCNGKEIRSGLENLTDYADEIFYRENIGFDAGGFKDALCRFIGWDKILQYDELVLVNDSMFGPFKPMTEIFSEMDTKLVDFWGLTKHGEYRDRAGNHLNEHIQSFFFVIRSSLLSSRVFQEYWEEMPYYKSYQQTVQQHETRFTSFFSKLGYTYDTLADTEINDSIHPEYNYSQYALIPFEMIKKRNFPFLKKQPIAFDALYCQTQENLRQAIDYVDCETGYDVNLIWDNIIRTLNMADLQRNLHLQYIISPKKNCKNQKNAVVVVFVKHIEAAEYILEYLEKIRSLCTIKIFAEKDDECLKLYRMRKFQCRRIHAGEIRELISEIADGDMVCVLHDVDMTSNLRPNQVGKSYLYHIWENLAKSAEHIAGILDWFDREPRLGFLAPPQPNFESYFGKYGSGWDGKSEDIFRILSEAGLSCPVTEKKSPFRIANDFWIRGCVLKMVKKIQLKDYSYLSYLWTYLAQSSGYYSGIVESSDYAAMNEVNLQYYLQQIASQIKGQYGSFNNFFEMKKHIASGAVQLFCRKYRRIFVYGTGYTAKIYREFLPDIEAYVVSDGHRKTDELDGIPIKYLSEITVSDDCGVILCLNEQNQMQVIPLLKQHGVENYFCL